MRKRDEFTLTIASHLSTTVEGSLLGIAKLRRSDEERLEEAGGTHKARPCGRDPTCGRRGRETRQQSGHCQASRTLCEVQGNPHEVHRGHPCAALRCHGAE
jgi:hypothetical protein